MNPDRTKEETAFIGAAVISVQCVYWLAYSTRLENLTCHRSNLDSKARAAGGCPAYKQSVELIDITFDMPLNETIGFFTDSITDTKTGGDGIREVDPAI